MIKCPYCGSSNIDKFSTTFRCRTCGRENKEVNSELDKFLEKKDE